MKFIEPPVGSVVYSIREDLKFASIIERPNRFLVNVRLDGQTVNAHIHDPGRLKELIYPGAEITLRETHGVKTQWSVTTAITAHEHILLDTRFHNTIASTFIGEAFRSEVSHGDSRYDFAIDQGFVEVKGCTMQVGQYVIFPDAPSIRGVKHLTSLADLQNKGLDCNVIFLIFRRDAKLFYPNASTDPSFEKAFLLALDTGVHMYFPRFTLEGGDVIYCGRCEVGKDPFGNEEFMQELYSVVHSHA